MTPQEQISKLNTLLARVQLRAAAPRAAAPPSAIAAPVAPPAPVAAAPKPAPAPAPVAAPPKPAPVQAPPAAVAAPDFDMPEAEASVEAGEEMDYEVEVSAEVVEVDIDVEDDRGSHTQMVASAEHDDDDDGGTLIQTSTEVYTAPHAEPVAPPPSSQPRPVHAERDPFAAEAAAEPERHTPPPESGRQVATASAPPPARDSRRPTPLPPSEHGTLIGGWREPGRPPSPMPPRVAAPIPAPAPAPAPPPPVAAAPAAPAPITPEAIVPKIAKSGDVAEVQGTRGPISPQTFGDLLDQALDL